MRHLEYEAFKYNAFFVWKFVTHSWTTHKYNIFYDSVIYALNYFVRFLKELKILI